MKKTKIDYLTHTWNPLAMRCSPVSAGCDHCWHLGMADRMKNNPILNELDRRAYGGGESLLLLDKMNEPMKQKKPAIVGVQFMGDLFHEKIEYVYLESIFEVMEDCPQHQFIVLTKRPARMREFMFLYLHKNDFRSTGKLNLSKNIWLGVSVEDQATADQRIPILLKTPAQHRIVSAEPLLGPVDFSLEPFDHLLDNIDLVIAGGESGPYARPMDPGWIRGIRDQCQEARVPFFFKQWGEYVAEDQVESINEQTYRSIDVNGILPGLQGPGYNQRFWKVGKKYAGALLDEKIYRELPEALAEIRGQL